MNADQWTEVSDGSLQPLEHAVLSNSTSLRCNALHELQDRIGSRLPPETHGSILRLLFRTYPLYIDRPSRRAVQQSLVSFFKTPLSDENLKYLVHTLREESLKSAVAPGNAFVLVEWCSLLLQHLRDDPQQSAQWALDVICAHARLFETCLGGATRESLKHSATVVTRRALRAIFSSEQGENILRTSVTRLTEDSLSGQKNAPFLGVIAGVCFRLETKKPVMEELKINVWKYYGKDIIGSRTVIPDHISNGLNDFISSFATYEDLETQVWPQLEKSILRSPEIVFSGVIPPLCSAIPAQIDLSEVFASRFVKPLLSNLKSTNATIRNGAIQAFQSLVSRCQAEKSLLKAAEEVITPLKTNKITNAEQRALHSQLPSAFPKLPELSQTIVRGLVQVFSREASEVALEPEIKAFCKHLSYLIESGTSVSDEVSNAVSKGCGDKRVNFRKLWLTNVCEFLWRLNTEVLCTAKVSPFLRQVIGKLQQSFDEIAANPLPSSQSGIVSLGYIMTALSVKLKGQKDGSDEPFVNCGKIVSQSLAMSPKPSFLLNPRIITKLTSRDDLTWAIRALSAVTTESIFQESDSATKNAWGQGFIYVICASNIPHTVRNEATHALTQCYLKSPRLICEVINGALWHWLLSIENGDKDAVATSAGTNNKKLHMVVKSISPRPSDLQAFENPVNQDTLKEQLVQFIVLCHDELIPGAPWIDIALRTGTDPGELVREMPEKCLEQILYSPDDPIRAGLPKGKQAAWNAAATLAFVAPDVMIPRLVGQIEDDLLLDRISKFSPTDAAIARTPEGTTFVDVLSTKSKQPLSDKNSKDYDTLKWEEELREQLAKKKGQPQKKLSADEQAKVNAQLAKETAIRKEVQYEEEIVKRGAGVIKALANGPPTDAEGWINPAVKALTTLSRNGAGLFVGDTVSSAYIACADRISSRLDTMRPFIGAATLRALGDSHLPLGMDSEPLGSLVVRILYRLRFTSEQRPFDSVTLGYILPLFFVILDQNGIKNKGAEEGEEQVLLVLEFLSFHTEIFSDSRLPRTEVIRHLVSAMRRYTQHYKVIKDTLLDFCRCISSNIENEELEALMEGTIVPETSVRTALLQAILSEIDLTEVDFSEHIWLGCHDSEEENVKISEEIWEENALDVDESSPSQMLKYLESKDSQLREAAARALAHAVKLNSDVFPEILEDLKSRYRQEIKPKAPEKDAYGMPMKVNPTDKWEARSGIALAFREMAGEFPGELIIDFLRFLIDEGPLADLNSTVRRQMAESGTAIVTISGQNHVEELIPIFERTLETSDKATERSDWLNEAVIVLYGSLGRHLKSGDKRLQTVIRKLLETLSTPSETVQSAVADCLPPLVRLSPSETGTYVQEMLDQLCKSKKYAARRGAAYGLAGLVSGAGISSLRQHRIMAHLQESLENKKDQNQRQGAVLAYELFATILGRIFEPYVIQIVPQLLAAFGDPSIDVRDACLDAAKACFSSLSSFGVKEILPTLLDGLDDPQWRSKKGACDLLGAMAYLDPHQLAASLPEITPALTVVLNDSHKEVRSAANRSLQRFGEVISNPEVKNLVGVLLKALSDPTKYTDEALDALIKVSFVHYLDAPSLALVARILERGLEDRSATKRKSAEIIGSLAHLTERKDLISHLPVLVAGLRLAIVDPVPTTRATASKALGSLIEKLGEDALPDLIPGLMSTLKSDTGAGDRLGSAQALSEVLAGLGTSRLEEILPTILQNVSSSKPTVREGFMSLFIFLPACFGNGFAAYLNKVIPPILAGLADDIEAIRDTSLRAGRLLVNNFASKAIDLLLPELERGLADDSHRIRLSSVELVGDLLFNITGISKTDEEDEEEEEAAQAGQSLLEVLGEEKRNKVLSSLYICRCDTSGLVRSASINIWKALVATPRTLKDLVPTLSQLLIRRLASSNMEQKVIAGNALGDLIRKAGEGVLSTLLPSLEEGLQNSTDVDARQGICIALRELILSASPDALQDHEKSLISIVRTALVDNSENVREAAAEAFDVLQQILGKKAVDQVLPYLLSLLRNDQDAEQALSALLTLLTETTRANVILPNLVPTLLTSPITSFNARAIASLSEVAGPAMTRRIPAILNALMDNIVSTKDDDLRLELSTAFDTVLVSVDEYDGLNAAMNVMLSLMKNDDHRRRANAAVHLATFFADAEVDYSRYHPDLIRVLLVSLDDHDKNVVQTSWTALNRLMGKLRKEEMELLVVSTRQVLRQVGVPGADLPGFSLPKGIMAIFPIFLQGLLNGSVEQRVQSALAIADIIDRTSEASLKPLVTQITGPLIRVVSERSVDLKCAVFFSLNKLLEKIPLSIKPFLPQLQRTFARGLADSSSETLRNRAAKGLGILITLTPRVDPLIAELITGSKTPDVGVKNAMFKALHEVVSKAGGNMSEASRQSILSLIDDDANNSDDVITITNAKLLGALVKTLPDTAAIPLVKNRIITTHFSQASILGLNSLLVESPSTLLDNFSTETPSIICHGIASKNLFICDNSLLAAGKYLLVESDNKNFESTKSIFEALAPVLQPGGPGNTRRLALVVIRTVSRLHPELVRPHLPLLAPPIFSSVRDVVIPVKLAAEAAFLSLFSVIDSNNAVFDKYMAGPGAELPAGTKRSMQDYFKRVAMRLGGQARERREAEGGQGGLGLSNDELDDEREVWSVGKMDLGEDSFGGE